jgi:hypothetical protein
MEAKTEVDHGRKYSVRVDEKLFHSTNAIITGEELLALVGKRPCQYLMEKVNHHADDRFVYPQDKFDLSAPGLEEFASVLRDTVTIYVNGDPYDISWGKRTVEDLLRLVNQTTSGYDLLEEKNGKLLPVSPDIPVEIEGCEVFHTQPKSGASS